MSAAASDEDGFTLVMGRKGRRQRKPRQTHHQIEHGAVALSTHGTEREADPAEALPRMKARLDKLRTQYDDYGQRVLQVVLDTLRSNRLPTPSSPGSSTPWTVVCLGLGSMTDPAASAVSFYQLMLLQDLVTILQPHSVLCYDPEFTAADRSFIAAQCKANVPETNPKGHYPCNTHTLFYLPHVPLQLLDTVLLSNWSQSQLTQTVLLCNSFEGYLERQLKAKAVESAAPNLVALMSHGLVKETSLTVPFFRPDTFNDLSTHIFREEALQSMPTSFWTSKPKSRLVDDEVK